MNEHDLRTIATNRVRDVVDQLGAIDLATIGMMPLTCLVLDAIRDLSGISRDLIAALSVDLAISKGAAALGISPHEVPQSLSSYSGSASALLLLIDQPDAPPRTVVGPAIDLQPVKALAETYLRHAKADQSGDRSAVLEKIRANLVSTLDREARAARRRSFGWLPRRRETKS